ncbi:MAG: NnrS family protein [Silicimonas sp.]|nr:NnrS family protein [Silicimonas sp.]
MRHWQGPAIFSFGFRPFFLMGSLWSALAMGLWLLMLGGQLDLPTGFDPITWHANAFLVGYLGAILSGFLLTAVPNWTGGLPVVGWRLAFLAFLWVAGRLAMLVSEGWPVWLAALLDLASLIALFLFLGREIIVGRNWKNLIVLAILGCVIAGGAMLHLDNARGVATAEGIGFRFLLGAGIMMISVIGGRIVPSFTRNWLVKNGKEARPAPPMQAFDKVALIGLAVAILLWVFDVRPVAFGALIVAGILHAFRLARWKGAQTLSEPLVWVLHLGYGLVPLGAILLGAAELSGNPGQIVAALHIWMAGAIGLMTLAVMTRATLGHTGQALRAGQGTVAVYLALLASVALRAFAGISPGDPHLLYMLSGLFWIAAFGGFAVLYGPGLLRPRPGT